MRNPARQPLPLAVAAVFASAFAMQHPVYAGQTLTVLSCLDPTTPPDCRSAYDGTLRMAYACAQDGDVVDLTQLRCSTLSLSSELSNGTAADLELRGPGRDKLALDGGGAHRVLRHAGVARRLIVRDLSIEHGRYQLAQDGQGGGCIVTSGSVNLVDTRVAGCELLASNEATARGGGVFAAGYASLESSIVSDSHASSDVYNALGGGIYAGTAMDVRNSTVSGNSTHVANEAAVSAGGGVYSPGRGGTENDISHSLLSGNSAGAGAAAYVRGTAATFVFDSTIAGNHLVANGLRGAGAVLDVADARATWSTFAGNTFEGGGFDLAVAADTHVPLYNVVLDNGITGSGDVQVVGTPNLIRNADPHVTLPGDTLTADPMLGELRANGGPTLTMAPKPGSPLVGAGAPLFAQRDDQRGAPRHTAGATDIGAVESETLFFDDFE